MRDIYYYMLWSSLVSHQVSVQVYRADICLNVEIDLLADHWLCTVKDRVDSGYNCRPCNGFHISYQLTPCQLVYGPVSGFHVLGVTETETSNLFACLLFNSVSEGIA